MREQRGEKRRREKSVVGLKRRLFSATVMLLVAAILMTTTSYAWFVLSVAPEVSGITTNIGANGSLEIALLTAETKADLGAIRTTVGESLSQRKAGANNTWGNLVDLSYAEYGLGEIALMPARLNVVQGAEGYAVDTNLLSVPSYGYDGRIVELNDETMSATYHNNEFSLVVGEQDYGVRAIGSTDALSAQASALALAKANITAFTNNARSSVVTALDSYGDTLLNIVVTHAMNSGATYNEAVLNDVKAMIEGIDEAAEYIDRALRQGLVAVAASEISSKTTFTEVRDRVMDTSRELNQIVQDLSEVGTLPEEFQAWVDEFSELQNDINAAKNAADALVGGEYSWEQFRGVLDFVMNVDGVYINGTLVSEFDRESAESLIGGSVELTLAPGSGVFADIAKFVDNYSAEMTTAGTNVEIKTASATNPPHLAALATEIKGLEAASGGEDAEAVALNSTYGYAIDLAFRCNASISDLLLQTTPEHRVYTESESGSAMGGGSCMEFKTNDESLTIEKMTLLMDAVRVAFINDKNDILGIAKLNTSNRSTADGSVKAPLYLYEYSLSDEDGSILMGERRKEDNTITALEQSVAKAITAVVWLDGDVVDNTMVSATESTSVSGTLNLQFASSAELIPASNSELLNITADKTELMAVLTEYEKADGVLAAGQGRYTDVSWNAFVEAYEYAVAVNENLNANDSQVYYAALALAKAESELQEISADAVEAKIAQVREVMGSSTNVARYIVKNEDGRLSVKGDTPHTQEEHDEWTVVGEVYQVDYANNLHDEGNEILTQIYTDESWTTLAHALYDAEAAVLNVKLAAEDAAKPVEPPIDGEEIEVKAMITDGELNNILTALEEAYKALQRQIFYAPYEYEGVIYYEAICDAGNADTYGKWYDSQFKRVVADLTILNLDAYAEATEVFGIVQGEYVTNTTASITPYIRVLSDIYPELSEEVIKGASWNAFDEEYLSEPALDPEEPEEEEDEPDSSIHDCVPVISEIYEVIYENESAGIKLNLSQKTGKTEIGAVVLTENGVVGKISKEIEIYEKADGIEINADDVLAPIEGEAGSCNVTLVYGEAVETPERSRIVTWASEDTEIATVSGGGTSCIVTAKKAGQVKITVSMETVQGNVYTDYVYITVVAPAESTP